MAGNTGAWVAAVRGIAEGQPGLEADPQLPCHVFHETTYRIPTPCDACHQPLRGDIGIRGQYNVSHPQVTPDRGSGANCAKSVSTTTARVR